MGMQRLPQWQVLKVLSVMTQVRGLLRQRPVGTQPGRKKGPHSPRKTGDSPSAPGSSLCFPTSPAQDWDYLFPSGPDRVYMQGSGQGGGEGRWESRWPSMG